MSPALNKYAKRKDEARTRGGIGKGSASRTGSGSPRPGQTEYDIVSDTLSALSVYMTNTAGSGLQTAYCIWPSPRSQVPAACTLQQPLHSTHTHSQPARRADKQAHRYIGARIR